MGGHIAKESERPPAPPLLDPHIALNGFAGTQQELTAKPQIETIDTHPPLCASQFARQVKAQDFQRSKRSQHDQLIDGGKSREGGQDSITESFRIAAPLTL